MQEEGSDPRSRRSPIVLAGLLVVLGGVLWVQVPRFLKQVEGPPPLPGLDTVEECRESLASSSTPSRLAAARKLGEWGAPRALPAVPDLARALAAEQNPDACAELAWSLQQLGEPGVQALLAELQVEDWQRRNYALFLIGTADARPAGTIPAVCAVLKRDSQADVRASAARALGQLAEDTPQVREALGAALQDADAQVRQGAQASLDRLDR